MSHESTTGNSGVATLEFGETVLELSADAVVLAEIQEVRAHGFDPASFFDSDPNRNFLDT